MAGHRRRRHAAGSGSSKPKIHRRVGRIPASSTTNSSSNSITTTANTASTAANSNTNTSTNYTGNSTTRGAQGGTINGKTNSGYSYSTRTAGRKPQRQQLGQQRLAGNGDELVRTELQKLEQLKALLVETALWQRLVEGLKSIFPQLGLAFPAPEKVPTSELQQPCPTINHYCHVSLQRGCRSTHCCKGVAFDTW